MKTTHILFTFLLLISACDKSSTESDQPQTVPVETETPVVTDPAVPTNPTNPSPTVAEEFMDLINDHRASLGLSSLIVDPSMNAIVQGHSDAMANGSVPFGHTGFSSRCASARSAIGGGNRCGENVASGQKTAKAVYTSWMNSSGHRANIEQSRYTHCGFAFKKSSSGTIYWTHLFLEKN